MKRNIFLPEGSDFSRSEVDKNAEELKFEAKKKLEKLRAGDEKPKPLQTKPKLKKKEKPSSYGELLKEYQKKNKK